MSTPQIWFAPVPQLFWSEYSGRPFEVCIDCDRALQDCEFYVVQKRFVAKEGVFEMAMCHECRECLSQECSQQTMLAVNGFLAEHLSERNAKTEQLTESDDLILYCIDHCIVCSKHRAKCHRYSVGGLCRGFEIVGQISPPGQTPLMICDDCERGMADLVSRQTRDTWDRFVDEHFDGPPGLELDIPSAAPIAF